MLYFDIGHKSLHDHARPVVTALENNDDDEARRLVGRMVSRDSAPLDIAGRREFDREHGCDERHAKELGVEDRFDLRQAW